MCVRATPLPPPKINSKYSIVAKTSRAAVSLYNRFKRNVDDKALLDQAEANVRACVCVSVPPVRMSTCQVCKCRWDCGYDVPFACAV